MKCELNINTTSEYGSAAYSVLKYFFEIIRTLVDVYHVTHTVRLSYFSDRFQRFNIFFFTLTVHEFVSSVTEYNQVS